VALARPPSKQVCNFVTVSARAVVTQASVPMMDMSASQISMLVSSVSSSRFAGSSSSSAAPPLAPLDTGALGHASSPARPSGVSLNVQKVQANFATESDVSENPIALKVPAPASGELERDTGDSKPAYESDDDDDDDDQEESDQSEEGEDDDDEVSNPAWIVISPPMPSPW
jgi:hypothetical protein